MRHRLPVLFAIRGTAIYVYPAFLALGLTVGLITGTIVGQAAGMNPTRLYAALVLLTIPALVGSRLLYVVTHWRFYRDRRSLIWSRDSGGAALYGGLLLALACSWPLLRLLRVPIGAFWDVATITILVGMMFTRIGCLLNGCCAGRPVAGWFGMTLLGADGVWRRRVPTQLLEFALAGFLLYGILSWSAPPFAGARFLAALAIYAAVRIPLGATREIVDRVSGVNVYAALSLSLMLAAAIALVALW